MDKRKLIRNMAVGAIIGTIIVSSRGCSLNKDKPTKEELDVSRIEFSTISEEEIKSRLEEELETASNDFDIDSSSKVK